MIHNHYMARRWHELNRRLTLFRGHDMIVHHRVRADYTADQEANLDGDPIHNLIVTLPPSNVVQAIGHIRHRLDHRSTICLINDGLGVAEALIEAYFPDESRRPIFLLGHFTASLDHVDHLFSVSEVRPGRLYLTLFPPQGLGGNHEVHIKRYPPLERTARGTHFIRLLTAMPGLNATGHPIADFMRYKLPTVAFRTIVDPLAALFECRYDGLRENPYARQLMDQLLGELTRVLSRLPECRDSAKFRQVALFTELRDEVFRKMVLKRTADSKMRSQVARGWDTDVDFLSGYFVRRGRQLHCSVEVLDSIMSAVKAKRLVELKKLAGEIPFQKAAP
jgi:cytochrome b translational activator protein CBS2